MEIKNLEIILALDSEKHFNRAAEKLNISQPALSMKLKSLENEIGVKLVKRGKNFIGLTKEGEILKEKFKYIVKEYSEIKQLSSNEIFSFGHLGDGNIHINIVSERNKDNLVDEIYSLLKQHHGSPSAEHGIGQRKKEIWTKFEDYQDKYKLLQTLKKSMDPKNILSPKVFFE